MWVWLCLMNKFQFIHFTWQRILNNLCVLYNTNSKRESKLQRDILDSIELRHENKLAFSRFLRFWEPNLQPKYDEDIKNSHPNRLKFVFSPRNCLQNWEFGHFSLPLQTNVSKCVGDDLQWRFVSIHLYGVDYYLVHRNNDLADGWRMKTLMGLLNA